MQACHSAWLLQLFLAIAFLMGGVANANTAESDKTKAPTAPVAQKKPLLQPPKTDPPVVTKPATSKGKFNGWLLIQDHGFIGTNEVSFSPQGLKLANPLFLLIFNLHKDRVVIGNAQNKKCFAGSPDKAASYMKMMGYKMDEPSKLSLKKFVWSPWKLVKKEKKLGIEAQLVERHILNPPPYSSRKEWMWVATEFKMPPKLLEAYLRWTDDKSATNFPLERWTVVESPQVGYKTWHELTTKEAKRMTLSEADFNSPAGYTEVHDMGEFVYNDVGSETLGQLADTMRKKHHLPPSAGKGKSILPANPETVPKAAPNTVP